MIDSYKKRARNICVTFHIQCDNNPATTMNKNLVIVLIVIAGVVWGEVQSCTSCGSECQSACGTRHFRTCCFNYLKKRNSDSLVMDPSLRLELWLAKSRNPYFQQRNFLDPSLDLPETIKNNQ